MAQRLAWPAGAVLLVASLYFLARTLAELGLERLAEQFSPLMLGSALAGAIAYAALLALLARGWCAQAEPTRAVPPAQAWSIYGRAVVAKYVPGSVLQYASRQWLGAQAGFAQRAMARASLIEILLHCAIAAGIAALLVTARYPLAGLAGAAVSGLALVLIARRGGARVGEAIACQTAFFGGFALLTLCFAAQFAGLGDALVLTGLFLVAWLVGFVVPLAPGGVGVREAALVALVGPREAGVALALALLLRLVTLLGDALFGIGAWLATREASRANRQAS